MKNWKKQKTRRGLSLWKNDVGKFIYINSSKRAHSGKNVYIVDSNHSKYYLTSTYFDTRAKAMAHVLDFMSRHDNPSSAGEIIFSQGVDLKTMFKG